MTEKIGVTWWSSFSVVRGHSQLSLHLWRHGDSQQSPHSDQNVVDIFYPHYFVRHEYIKSISGSSGLRSDDARPFSSGKRIRISLLQPLWPPQSCVTYQDINSAFIDAGEKFGFPQSDGKSMIEVRLEKVYGIWLKTCRFTYTHTIITFLPLRRFHRKKTVL